MAVDSPAITQRAKQYGKAVPGHPELLIYFFEEERGGFKIIEYEVAKYWVENGYPLESGGTFHGIKLFNMEFHPEYFGPYPVPSITPVGRTRKHYTLQNGVYLLESDEGERVLSICYPIWSTELSDYSLSISKRIWSEGASTIENNSAERFFLAADICIPVYEMLAVREEWVTEGKINLDKLKNAIWSSHPEYAIMSNLQKLTCDHMMLGGILHFIGEDTDPVLDPSELITFSPELGVDFFGTIED